MNTQNSELFRQSIKSIDEIANKIRNENKKDTIKRTCATILNMEITKDNYDLIDVTLSLIMLLCQGDTNTDMNIRAYAYGAKGNLVRI